MEKLLTDMLLTETNALVMAGVFCLLMMVHKIFPEITTRPIYKRLLPVLPELLCTGLLFMPGIHAEGQPWTVTVLTGLILGVASSKFHKVFKQTLLGDDKDIKNGKLKTIEEKVK